MKLLQDLKKILVIFHRSIMNEGHTEQGIFMMLMFITDTINCGLGLLKSRSKKANQKEAVSKINPGIAITKEITNYLRRMFERIPIYVLKEEEIIDRLIREKFLGQDSNDAKFVGFDCEWVNDGFFSDAKMDDTRPTAPVALLQLCTLSECFLIRISHLNFHVPKMLKRILEDRSILKFGVGVEEDCRRLRQLGVNICGAVDIRYLIQRCQHNRDIIKHPERIVGLSLKSLAAGLLGIEIEKSFKVRCSDWQADKLSDWQIAYAANDAIIGLKIFLALCMQKTHSKRLLPLSEFSSKKTEKVTGEKLLLMSFLCDKVYELNQSKLSGSFNVWEKFSDGFQLHSEITKRGISLCQGIVDLAFKNKNKSALLKQPSKSVSDSSLNKQNTKTIPVRKKPLYHNCLLVAPDGTVLCTCDKKKADWYIIKEIGKAVSKDPFTVQLNFDPSGRPFVDRDYYTTEKENRCVVCGKEDDYVKKMVVPRDYRRHFPSYLKDHLSHDVLLLCVLCHQISEIHDLQLKRKIAQEHDAPLNSSKSSDDPQLKRVRSAAKALFHSGDQIPEERKRDLEMTLRSFTKKELIDDTTLKELAEIGTTTEYEFYQGSHGERVVGQLVKQEKLKDFVKMWREHFLFNMKPKFLPKLWSSDHNLTKFDD